MTMIQTQKETERFKWYSIWVVTQQEKAIKQKIEREITNYGYSNWVSNVEVPLDKTMVTINGKKVLREKVILPCYIFIRMDISHGEILPIIRNVQGVLGFINPSDGKTSKFPEPLRQTEIEKFLKLGDATVTKETYFKPNDNVKILDGPFATFTGEIRQVLVDKKLLKVSVKIFSRETLVDLSFDQVDKVVTEKV